MFTVILLSAVFSPASDFSSPESEDFSCAFSSFLDSLNTFEYFFLISKVLSGLRITFGVFIQETLYYMNGIFAVFADLLWEMIEMAFLHP